MARAYQQSRPIDDDQDHNNPAEWQSLKRELMVLLDQVDNQVTRARAPEPPRPSYAEPARERYAEPPRERFEPAPEARHRDALRSVQRAISRFEEAMPAPTYPPNPRDSLQAAINQIRASQGQSNQRRVAPPPLQQAPAPAPQAAPRVADPAPLFDRLAQSVNGLSGWFVRLEGEIKAQIKTGANVKDVADQVAQLANVVERRAGAVGETGQVKRLEGQIASLGKIMSQGREMDIQTLTRRLDDVASTVGKLAELQVHYADRVQSPVESQAFQDGMRSIEESVRAVYDRIDSLERQRSLAPQDLEHLSGEMARFSEALRDGQQAPMHLVELVDALNTRIADVESGDRLLHGLRKDLSALRDSVIVALTPRFDAIEQRMETLSTRDDMAEIGRQIGALTDRIGERPIDPGLGQLEAQVRLLVARMDQTGEQLSGLAKLYSSPVEGGQVMMPDFDAVADLVATRTAEAMQRQPVSLAPAPMDPAIHDTIARLEDRIATMLSTMHRDPEVDAFDGMQAGITEVNERLKRLEMSLMERSAPTRSDEMVRRADIASIIADAEETMPAPRQRVDTMPRSPAEDAPLNAPAFPEPVGPVAQALEAKNGPRKRHPGLGEDVPLAARYDAPAAPPAPAGFDPEAVERPAAPQPSFGFADAAASAPRAAVAPEVAPGATARTNTFIEAARRAAQRQTAAKPEPQSNSLIGRALSRFQSGDAAPTTTAPKPDPKAKKDKKVLAGDKPARTEFKPEPPPMSAGADIAAPTASLEPAIGVDQHGASIEVKPSFLTRHRRAILLGALVVAGGFLAANFIAQRMTEGGGQAQPATPANTETPAPATTGDISRDVIGAPVLGAQPLPPRVIPLAESSTTGSINSQSFTKDATPPMPTAFGAATEVANADPNTTTPAPAPLAAETPSPVKVEMPPENVGQLDLRQAASDGDARAQFEVAAIYTEGRAVPQDYKAAATWYERAAAQGFAPAQYRLGSLYENGNGVTKDLNTARLWYERAAEAGNRMSMHNLAALYAGGQLGKQQFDSAAKWFEEAAKRGLTDSQFNLGVLYARVLGVAQSMPDSFKWFSLAAKSGDKDATKARDDIARSLDPATVAKITADVNAFKPEAIDLKANFAPIGSWSKSFDPGETITTRDIVSSVQKALGKLGYDIGTPDGIAGKKTQDAIRAFEAATGMSEVGQINPRLLAVLGSQPV